MSIAVVFGVAFLVVFGLEPYQRGDLTLTKGIGIFGLSLLAGFLAGAIMWPAQVFLRSYLERRKT